MEKHKPGRKGSESSHELHKKYADLPGSSEVNRAIAREKDIHKEDPSYRESQTQAGRIDAYLRFLESRFSVEDIGVFVMNEDDAGDRRAGDAIEILEQNPLMNEAFHKLKERLLDTYTMKINDEATLTRIAEGLYASEKKLATERGMGAQIPALEGKKQEVIARYKTLVSEKHEIQKETLASWLDYLQQNDAKHPMWFRYLVVRSLVKMGALDKEELDYSNRNSVTIAPFPELNSEALGWVYSQMLKYKEGGLDLPAIYFVPDEETQKKKDAVVKAVRSKDFAKLYAFAQVETVGESDRESLIGEWKKYEQGSDHAVLERAIRGKGTGWCTAEGSARSHLKGGDFYVYFTNNKAGKPTEPRIAIRMERGQVAEVRGVDRRQGVEPVLLEKARELYSTLPGGEKYDKKDSDMKHMSALVEKQKTGQAFSREDLVFLYEINALIEGFADDRDSRIVKLRQERNPDEDMCIVFDCDESQIARSVDQINESTKAYVGKLESGVFKSLPDSVEYIYTTFPEGMIRRQNFEIGGKTVSQLEAMMEKAKFRVDDGELMISEEFKKSIYEPPQFTKLKSPEQMNLVRLTVGDLGFPDGATIQEIFDKAIALGLELCPPEVGPYYRLQYTNQPMREYVNIGMKPIAGRNGYPNVFRVNRDDDGAYLDRYWAPPKRAWLAYYQFVFRIRKSDT